MASEGPPGAEVLPPDLGAAIAALNSWSNPELQARLAEIGAPNMGPREELIDRLKGYMIQAVDVCHSQSLNDDASYEHDARRAPPPGMHMGMEPGLPPGMSQDEQLKMAQHRAAMVLQQEEMAKQGDVRVMNEQDLLEQQKRAAVLLEQERQHEMAMQGGPGLSLPTATLIQVFGCCMFTGPLPPGLIPNQKHRGPLLPGDDGEWQNEEVGVTGPKIPQALEKILQLKEIRQEQNTDKNRKRRNRKKKNKKKRALEKKEQAEQQENGGKDKENEKEPEVEIEYVTEEPEIYDPNFIFFKRIFDAFKVTDDVKKEKEKEPEKEKHELPYLKKKGVELLRKDDSDDSDEEEDKNDGPKISKKKLRRMNRLTVAELKQLVARPDVVEMHDVTAQEPKLLVHLKATRNTVPVPRHWCFKRKYLQGKRGIEKPPFQLPEFIRRTGIQEMREALQEKEDAKTMKTKMREKVRPKMGKIDIDYQKLHDAFFKWQIKPKLTIHGDLYYEGKEFETRLKEKKPGDLSDELRIALGMPVGPVSAPPWLIAMQRYGPPPSYPNLKIPGLNAPIPDNCTFGYHAGGWGKPPVDEMGKPLYGDVFGTNSGDFMSKAEDEEVDHTTWGELEPSDEESSEEEEEEESDEEKPDETGFFTPADSGLITPGGFSSVPAGMETPELIELRKKKIEEAMDGNETPQLFTVLPERRTGPVGAAMMASTHIYDMSAAMAGRKAGGGSESQGVEVALAPEELELDPMAMTQKYEEHVREQQAQVAKEDFSDMVAEHAAKQKQKKRKAQPQDTRGGAKKYKEFKF
uniref:Splicing factor 3b, subunit 2 n=1 Tax=Neogobius melanostomus TaxID=47308 RepID=A0A8C6WYS7_9GOBI